MKNLIDNINNNNLIKKETFLKELIFNGNEAVLKLKNKLENFEGMVEVYFEPSDDSITIVDNGIGMNKEELTLLTSRSLQENSLGFLSAFLVAQKISIISKKLGEESAYKYVVSKENNSLTPCINDENSGTVIYIKLKKEFAEEFTNKENLISYINKFIKDIQTDLYISYYENLEERIEKLNN